MFRFLVQQKSVLLQLQTGLDMFDSRQVKIMTDGKLRAQQMSRLFPDGDSAPSRGHSGKQKRRDWHGGSSRGLVHIPVRC